MRLIPCARDCRSISLFKLVLVCGMLALSPHGVATADDKAAAKDTAPRFFYTSQGKTGLASADGSGQRWLELDVPGQATWQPTQTFADRNRVVMLSMEPRRDGPGRPFEQYYTQTPTHIWIHDLTSGKLDEICNHDRIAPFETPALLISEERILVQVVKDGVGQIMSMKLDGTDARPFTQAGEGLPYGLSLSPDRRRVAFHLASPQGYQVWTSDVDGGNRVKVAAAPEHLYFGTSWSPDGVWILYVDCHYTKDPGHDWADVCIGRADGSEHRVLTKDQEMWFAAAYGDPKTRGGGSNLPAWTHDGAILFPRRTPGAQVVWQYRVGKPDEDHFNRDYKPESARGGTVICRLDPRDGSMKSLTHSDPAVWDFRASESPDGRYIVFCRAGVGEGPTIWVMDFDGKILRRITQGFEDRGADHPRWLGGR